jgi:hypothetical protein
VTLFLWFFASTQETSLFWSYLLGITFLMFSTARTVPLIASMTEFAPTENRTSILLVQNTFQQLFSALGAFLGGWIMMDHERGYPYLFGFSAIVILGVLPLVFKLPEREYA